MYDLEYRFGGYKKGFFLYINVTAAVFVSIWFQFVFFEKKNSVHLLLVLSVVKPSSSCVSLVEQASRCHRVSASFVCVCVFFHLWF